jgi:uncharacterized membrane protein YecN with MAPEG domain
MVLAESVQTYPLLLHLAGMALVFRRLWHVYGISQTLKPFTIRVAGTGITFTVIGVLALACLNGTLRIGL